MTAPHPLEQKLLRSWPLVKWQDVTLMVTCSGGADSVALLRAIVRAGQGSVRRVVVGHFNHQLRPGSNEEQAWVTRLCEQLQVELQVGTAPPRDQQTRSGDGLEADAREARYAFLTAAASQVGARYLATAHTASDQAETVLHRILRGTGVAGLAGIPRFRRLSEAVTLIRPLLEVTRDEVIDYLQTLGQTWCEDESNRDPSLTRNRIRHDLLPKLRAEYAPSIDEALRRLARQARDIQDWVRSAAEPLLLEVCVRSGAEVSVDLQRLATVPIHLRREVWVLLWQQQGWPLQSLGFEELTLLAEAYDQPPNWTLTLPGQIVIRRRGSTLMLIAPSGFDASSSGETL